MFIPTFAEIRQVFPGAEQHDTYGEHGAICCFRLTRLGEMVSGVWQTVWLDVKKDCCVISVVSKDPMKRFVIHPNSIDEVQANIVTWQLTGEMETVEEKQ